MNEVKFINRSHYDELSVKKYWNEMKKYSKKNKYHFMIFQNF